VRYKALAKVIPLSKVFVRKNEKVLSRTLIFYTTVYFIKRINKNFLEELKMSSMCLTLYHTCLKNYKLIVT